MVVRVCKLRGYTPLQCRGVYPRRLHTRTTSSRTPLYSFLQISSDEICKHSIRVNKKCLNGSKQEVPTNGDTIQSEYFSRQVRSSGSY